MSSWSTSIRRHARRLDAILGLRDAPAGLLLRVAVRETEAWLLADREGLAKFAGVPASKVTQQPEGLIDPKQCLVNLVRHSRNRRLATELVPARGSRVPIGPLYNERLSVFVREQWDVDRAAQAAPSLARAVQRLKSFP